MNLNNFEDHINDTILARGKNYYKNKNVEALEEIEDGEWTATVEGSDTYFVEVSLNSSTGEITGYDCDCPYDGGICKHLVAVLYTIRNHIKIEITSTPNTKGSPQNIADLLARATPHELRTFVQEYAKKDKVFRLEVALYFAHLDTNIHYAEQYKKLVGLIINKYKTQNYLEYRNAIKCGKELSNFLKSNEKLVEENPPAAFVLALQVLAQVMDIYISSDDSEGELGGAQMRATKLISNLIKKSSPSFGREIFESLLSIIANQSYFDHGDVGGELLNNILEVAIRHNLYQEYWSFCSIQKHRLKNRHSDYYETYLIKQKIQFLRKTNREPEIQEIINENLHLSSIRKLLVEELILNAQYAQASTLIQEGIQIAEEKKQYGVVNDWKKIQLTIAEKLQNTSDGRKLYYHFTFTTPIDWMYYEKWKATYSPEDWQPVIHAIITEWEQKDAKSRAGYFAPTTPNPILCIFYLKENKLDSLCQYLIKYPSLTYFFKYANTLFPKYKDPISKAMIDLVVLQAGSADTPNAYSDWVNNAESLLHLLPSAKQALIDAAEKAVMANPRRRSMKEQYEKFIKKNNHS